MGQPGRQASGRTGGRAGREPCRAYELDAPLLVSLIRPPGHSSPQPAARLLWPGHDYLLLEHKVELPCPLAPLHSVSNYATSDIFLLAFIIFTTWLTLGRHLLFGGRPEATALGSWPQLEVYGDLNSCKLQGRRRRQTCRCISSSVQCVLEHSPRLVVDLVVVAATLISPSHAV